MKTLFLAVILFAGAVGPAAAAEFDFLLEEKDGMTRATIVNLETGAAAIAAGGLDLQLIGDAEAAATAQALMQESCAAPAATAEPASPKSKVVIHKMSYHEDAYDVRGEKQVRIANRDTVDRAGDDDAKISDRPAAGADAPVGRTRTIRISRADGAEVLRYIDELSLDDLERASLKRAIGL